MRPRFVILALALMAAGSATAQERTPLPSVPVVEREAWGGAPPVAPMIPQIPRALTIHHSGTPMHPERDPAETVRNLYAFSTRRDTLGDGRVKEPWPDIPYHFYIAPDGTTLETRDVAFEGDTNTRYNLSDQVLVVVEGNFEEETPTDAQLDALLVLSEALARQWGFGPTTVAGHRDRAPGQTVCPGDALEAQFPAIRRAVAEGARRALDGAWTADLRQTPDAPAVLLPLTLSADPDGRLSGTMGDGEIADGQTNVEWDAVRFSFQTQGPDGPSLVQGAVRGGRIEATTTGPAGTLAVWTATRAE